MTYAILIGDRFYASDDQPPVAVASAALQLSDRRQAEVEAETVRATWDVEPDKVRVVVLSA